MRHCERAIVILCLVLGCAVADDDDGGDDGSEAGPGSDPSGSAGSATTDPGESGGDSSGGSEDPTASPSTSGGDGKACGLFTADDMCTMCTIQNCCDLAQTCSDDATCTTCVELANAGKALDEQMLGCFEYAPFLALVDCVNDIDGCGPICNPVAPCAAYSCTYDSDCIAVGCGACTVSGTCQ